MVVLTASGSILAIVHEIALRAPCSTSVQFSVPDALMHVKCSVRLRRYDRVLGWGAFRQAVRIGCHARGRFPVSRLFEVLIGELK
jgi:hypothetical protein